MRQAALYVCGKIIVADSHLIAFEQLNEVEQNEHIVSGCYNDVTGEFESDIINEHFFNKEIFLIRHGLVANPNAPDPPLSDASIEEIYCLAESLKQKLEGKDKSEYRCITSPLLRCLQTTEIIAEVTGLKFTINLGIIETPCFLNEDKEFFVENRHEEFPNFNWETKNGWIIQKESKETFVLRIKNVLQSLPKKSILISHCGFITNMTRLATCNEKTKGVPTASLTHIDNQEVKCLGRICEN